MGPSAWVPSLKQMAPAESFQLWLTRPVGVGGVHEVAVFLQAAVDEHSVDGLACVLFQPLGQ
jgi:hypothetical protein